MKNTACIAAIFFFCLVPVLPFAEEYDENSDGKSDKWVIFGSNGTRRIEIDRDYDGMVDYAVVYDKDANLKEERLDFNHDGEMDDFYYYIDSILVRREIDSNYDTKVDIWVYIREGVYIEKYEMDTDFDGNIDTVKDYNKK